jgi:hypothetical protein
MRRGSKSHSRLMCLVLSTLCVGLDWFNQVPPSELATLIGGNGGEAARTIRVQ